MTTIQHYIEVAERNTPPESYPPAGHPSGLLYRGHTMLDSWDWSGTAPDGGDVVDEWSDGYRVVIRYDQARAIVTYCEGDLDLETYPTQESYQAALESAGQFYVNRR